MNINVFTNAFTTFQWRHIRPMTSEIAKNRLFFRQFVLAGTKENKNSVLLAFFMKTRLSNGEIYGNNSITVTS